VPGPVDLETEKGKVIVAAGTNVTVTKGGGIYVFASTAEIGDRAKIKATGNDSFSALEVEDVNIGNRVQLSSSGRDTEFDIYATHAAVLGDGIQVKLPTTGFFFAYINNNIVATDLSVKAGSIDIEAVGRENATTPPSRKLTLTNSRVEQTSKDGYLLLSAGEPGFHNSRDELTLANTLVKAKSEDVTMEPDPILTD
jgi:hypothetical protein